MRSTCSMWIRTGNALRSAWSSLRRLPQRGYARRASSRVELCARPNVPGSRLMPKFRLAAIAAAFVMPTLLAALVPAIAEQKITIGVSLAQDDNPFYIAMLRGIRARAQELGWEVAPVSANEDKLKQINGVQDLVARGVKGILISPIDAVGVNAAYDAAAAAKIPIVSVARGSTSSNQTIHVAMDEKQIGRDIAEWTAKKLGDKGKVALLMGPSGAPTFKNLGDGYSEVMAKYPEIHIVFRSD